MLYLFEDDCSAYATTLLNNVGNNAHYPKPYLFENLKDIVYLEGAYARDNGKKAVVDPHA